MLTNFTSTLKVESLELEELSEFEEGCLEAPAHGGFGTEPEDWAWHTSAAVKSRKESRILMQGYSLGCRHLRNRACRELLGKGLTVSPYGAVNKVFFLPDGYRLLECIDQPAARLKSRRPVRRDDNYQDADIADFEMTQAMNNSGIVNFKLCAGLLGKGY